MLNMGVRKTVLKEQVSVCLHNSFNKTDIAWLVTQ